MASTAQFLSFRAIEISDQHKTIPVRRISYFDPALFAFFFRIGPSYNHNNNNVCNRD